jgi:predicted metal-dependent peptidase
MDRNTRLSKAKTSLILEHPFIGSIALKMPMTISDDVPTAATDGKQVRFNPDFMDKLTDSQLVFLVAHEVFHPMLEHHLRAKGRDLKKWNHAADYVINQLLTDEGIGQFIEGGLLDESIYNAGGKTSEGIYATLADGEDIVPSNGSPAEQAAEAAEWRITVAQAAQAAKMMGKLSAGMQRFVDGILAPKVDWRRVLQDFVTKAKADTRTFARPNRRFLSQGLYLPTVSGETLGDIVFAVDCSGSISNDEINQYAAEIVKVHEDSRPSALHVVYFDSEVSHYDMFEPDDEVVVEPHGGGGTAFSPVFRYLEEQQVEPVACVFLTDLCCSDFGPEPEYPVLWVSTYSDQAPFGEVVKMEM